DRNFNRVPVGVPGELHIGGVNVGRGYFARPGLTAEKFVPDPFSDSGARLYRTGDLARYLRDGSIEFLGRIDHQVKIRGFRIEPGEVEAELLRLDPVREAVVVAREDRPGDPRIVAYVVPSEGRLPGTAELRDALRARLPEHMVPSAVVVLPALPLSPNGKVDRSALPPPGGAAPARREEHAAPRDELEVSIARIWREVLDAREVGIHDNFFDLGGHSLLLPRVLSGLRQVTERELSVIDLLQRPTVAALAEFLRETHRAPSAPSFVAVGARAGKQIAALDRQRQLAAQRRRDRE
ncbi:MAG TPA: phosphopantetheine-binding protein, partial [Longimicrobiaceae bacterium]|nr:phosphopantetheine-binding protein [Longimicrobiaceae bacterium]